MRSAGEMFLVLAVLASLGMTSLAVVRRQAQSLDLLGSLEATRREAALLEAERVRLSVQVKALESRSRGAGTDPKKRDPGRAGRAPGQVRGAPTSRERRAPRPR